MAKGRKRCRGLRHGRRKRKEGRERKKEKGNTVGTIYTHLPSFLIPRRRQHWEQTSYWLDLKGERKEETQKNEEQREIEMKHYFKGKYGSPVCLDKCVSPKVSLTDNV